MSGQGSLRVQVLQHVSFEDLGSIQPWLETRQAQVEYVRFFADEQLDPARRYDLVVVLGGPMSVHDEQAYPWLREEKSYLRALCAEQRAVLGICLGAQLIASALGAEVYPAREREIGWWPVYVAELSGDLKLPISLHAFQWHGETFALPVGARRLAWSVACENQAFLYAKRVLGLQFHLEVTPAGARSLLQYCELDLQRPGPYVQSDRALLGAPEVLYESSNAVMASVLDYLLPGA